MFDNIIIDIGSYSVKSGFGEEKLPRFNSQINFIKTKIKSFDKKEALNTIIKNSNQIEIENNNDHLLYDYNYEILNYIIQSELKVNPKDFNFLLIEKPNLHLNPKKKNLLYELLLEGMNAKSAFLPNQSILSIFSSGKTSGTSVELGENNCIIQPVYEGYGINQSIISSNFGGIDINKCLLKMLSERGINFNFTDSSNNKIITEIKEKYGYISLEYENDLINYSSLASFSSPKDENKNNSDYILPDNSILKLGSEKFRCAEILFKPNLINKKNTDGIHESIYKSINIIDFRKDDEDEEKIKFDLLNNIVLSGGTSMISGLEKRLVNEVNKISSLNYCHVTAIPDRNFAAWIGGSIISTVSVFQSLWVTKADYEENGIEFISQRLS